MTTTDRLTTHWNGIGDDMKPKPPIRNGSRYSEMDTIREFVFDEAESAWLMVSTGTDPVSDKVGIGAVGYMILIS